MPDVSLNGIEFTIKGSSDAASSSIARLQSQLDRLGKSLGNVKSVKVASSAMKDIGKSAKSASKPLGVLLSSLKRIAFYRAIRSAIKAVSEAFREGLKNAYEFSKINDGALASALDTVATKSLTMKNQLGAAFGALITAVAPIVVDLISLVTRLANALTMLFAALGGQSQYKKATDVWTEWGEAASGAGGAAKEALKYLAPFDELNRLPDDSGRGGGGGPNTPDYSQMFEYEDLPDWLQNLADKLNEFESSLRIAFSDVLFDWSDLTGEQIAEKVIVGLGAILGASVGFMIGGVPGAVVGTIIGASLGLAFDAVTFNHDGVLSREEIGTLVSVALSGLCGGIIGFVVGGPGGALIGATVGVGISGLLKGVEFFSDGTVSNLVEQFAVAMTALTGAVIGFTVGGPGGALIGAAVGIGVSAIIESISFSKSEGSIGGNGRTGIDYFAVDVLGLPTNQQWLDWGKTAIDWLIQGFVDSANEIAILFTGMNWSELDTWLTNGGELIQAWVADLPAKMKQAGISAINAFGDPIIDGLNSLIEKINSSGLAKALGIEVEPIEFKLIPDIPKEELTKNYDKAKAEIEAQSKQKPTNFNSTAVFTKSKNGSNWDSSYTTWSSTANWNKWQVYGSTSDSKVKSFTTWGSTANWNNWQVYGSKSGSKVSSFTTWNSTANFSSKNIDPSMTDNKGRMKIDAVAEVIHATVSNTAKALVDGALSFQKADGGAYYGGSWHSIPQYASGGRPHGTMFWAGEAGPEVVGHVGGRTEVLNQSQLAATMYASVSAALSGLRFAMTAPAAPDGSMGGSDDALYNAFVRALESADFAVDNTINMDGDTVYRGVVRRNQQRRRQLGYNPMLT